MKMSDENANRLLDVLDAIGVVFAWLSIVALIAVLLGVVETYRYESYPSPGSQISCGLIDGHYQFNILSGWVCDQ